jgi:RNA polymerase sigma-70 factor (ECF subfamily)
MIDRTDDRLVEEHLAGDARAFTELVRRYERRAARLAWRILDNAEDAEEVCQEAFLKAHQKIGELRARQSFFPWFFSIVLNLCRERLRLKQRAAARTEVGGRVLSGAAAEWSATFVADESAEAAQDALDPDDCRRTVARALEALPEKYRQVVALRCFENLSYTEMAQVLKSRKRTVRWRLYRARQLLRKWMDEQG